MLNLNEESIKMILEDKISKSDLIIAICSFVIFIDCVAVMVALSIH